MVSSTSVSGSDCPHSAPSHVPAVTSNTAADSREAFLRVPDLIDRWPIGRSSVYRLIKEPDFPPALVLLREKNGQARSMGFALSAVTMYEASHMVRLCDLEEGELAELLGDDGPGDAVASTPQADPPGVEPAPAARESGAGDEPGVRPTPPGRSPRPQLPASRRIRRPSTEVMA